MAERVLITDAEAFVGPACAERFAASGADVVTVTDPLTNRDDASRLVADRGPFDVVVANFGVSVTVAPVVEHSDETWRAAFTGMVDPLFWLFTACLPAMVEAGDGAVVVPTSSTALRTGRHPIVAYEAARSAQVAMVRSVGREMAAHGVRVNAVAPNYVENPTYYPPEVVANERFQRSVEREVPARRLGTGDEAAAVIEWLASPDASYLFGTIVPIDGGWSLG